MLSFSALADPTRRSILKMLASDGQLSASDISKRFHSTPPAISQHLKILREARLVHMEKRAQQRLYTIDPHGLEETEQWVAEMRQLWTQRFDALDEFLQGEVEKLKSSPNKEPHK